MVTVLSNAQEKPSEPSSQLRDQTHKAGLAKTYIACFSLVALGPFIASYLSKALTGRWLIGAYDDGPDAYAFEIHTYAGPILFTAILVQIYLGFTAAAGAKSWRISIHRFLGPILIPVFFIYAIQGFYVEYMASVFETNIHPPFSSAMLVLLVSLAFLGLVSAARNIARGDVDEHRHDIVYFIILISSVGLVRIYAFAINAFGFRNFEIFMNENYLFTIPLIDSGSILASITIFASVLIYYWRCGILLRKKRRILITSSMFLLFPIIYIASHNSSFSYADKENMIKHSIHF